MEKKANRSLSLVGKVKKVDVNKLTITIDLHDNLLPDQEKKARMFLEQYLEQNLYFTLKTPIRDLRLSWIQVEEE